MHKRYGFTVVEMLIVVAVIAILAIVSGLVWSNVKEQAEISQVKTDVSIIKNAIERYYNDNGEYPIVPSCSTCTGGELASFLVPKYLKELPRDTKKNQHYAYIYTNGGTTKRYAIQARMAGGRTCKIGKNMIPGWFSSAPECSF